MISESCHRYAILNSQKLLTWQQDALGVGGSNGLGLFKDRRNFAVFQMKDSWKLGRWDGKIMKGLVGSCSGRHAAEFHGRVGA